MSCRGVCRGKSALPISAQVSSHRARASAVSAKPSSGLGIIRPTTKDGRDKFSSPISWQWTSYAELSPSSLASQPGSAHASHQPTTHVSESDSSVTGTLCTEADLLDAQCPTDSKRLVKKCNSRFIFSSISVTHAAPRSIRVSVRVIFHDWLRTLSRAGLCRLVSRSL